MAARCSSVIEIDSDHSPFVDEPATIASIIQEVVNAKVRIGIGLGVQTELNGPDFLRRR